MFISLNKTENGFQYHNINTTHNTAYISTKHAIYTESYIDL